MLNSKLKILFCLTVCFAVLLVPILLEISPDGKAFASGSSKGQKSKKTGDYSYHGYTPPENNERPHPVPEPGTLVLLGTGVICIATVGRRIFKKK